MTGPHSHELSMLLRSLTLLFFLPTPGAAAERPVPVDLELAFLVDASGSIDAEGTELQRRGYADALRHPRTLNAITSGYLGRIAVAFIEFAADGCTRSMRNAVASLNSAQADRACAAEPAPPRISA